ncbi:hypothetical protein [Glycomyces sp. YM15]|uniref:hypothetical protein n=1 Tax=Glycomyces sp. YM15 TaxID=2800446 RepID=UPI001966A7D1|nr:hypothetical protein [Glycomyces sp. YM15]
MPSPDPLAEAIDRLYAVFAPVPRPTAINWCPCCLTEAEASRLLGPVPLHALTVDTLRPYADHVLLTVGDVADFRHYLPRIFEIACTSGFNWPDLEPLVGRLRIAEWANWAADEQSAVRGLLRAFWRKTLAAYPGFPDAETVLCAIANAEDDLTPYLDEWAAALRQPAAAAALLDLLGYSTRLRAGALRLANAFWDDHDEQVVRWFTGPALRKAVGDAFTAADAEATMQTLADLDELLGVHAQHRV